MELHAANLKDWYAEKLVEKEWNSKWKIIHVL